MDVKYYNREGSEITAEQFMELLGDEDYRRVAKDEIGMVVVSTAWLGFTAKTASGAFMHFNFETVIFGGLRDGEGERYETEQQALEGHKRWVAEIENDLGVQNWS